MPSDLPYDRVVSAIRRLGFVLDHEGRHSIYKDPGDPNRLMSIPRHPRVKRNLLQAVLRDVGVTEAEFMAEY